MTTSTNILIAIFLSLAFNAEAARKPFKCSEQDVALLLPEPVATTPTADDPDSGIQLVKYSSQQGLVMNIGFNSIYLLAATGGAILIFVISFSIKNARKRLQLIAQQRNKRSNRVKVKFNRS